MQDLAHLLQQQLRGREQQMLELLTHLVEAESPSNDPEAQRSVLGLLSDAFVERGFRVHHVRGRTSGGCLVAVPRERVRGARHQLLLGHADTVWPLGTLSEMKLQRDGDRLAGPGTYDMKAGLVQGLFAIDALRAVHDRALPVTPVFMVNTDEEIGSYDSMRTIERLARGADRCFVLEPSLGPDGKLKTARKGIGRFEVTIRGKAAHAGLAPEEGASAILELSHVIQKLFALNDPKRGVTVNVGTIDGGLQPNVVAPESTAVVDVRVPSREEGDRVTEAILGLKAQTPGTELRIEGGIGRPPMEPTEGNRRLWLMATQAAGELGIPIDEAHVGGGSDGNTTSLFAPTLDGLGAVGGGAHARDEHIRLERWVERVALLARLLAFPPMTQAQT